MCCLLLHHNQRKSKKAKTVGRRAIVSLVAAEPLAVASGCKFQLLQILSDRYSSWSADIRSLCERFCKTNRFTKYTKFHEEEIYEVHEEFGFVILRVV